MKTSSMCHLSPGRGRRRRRRSAKLAANFLHQRRTVSYETTTPRSARISSTSRRLRLNTWYSQMAWPMISAGVVRLAGPGRHGNLLGMTSSPNPYRGFRFPAEIIEHAVWLYHCFSLSLRDVELILAARGVVVSYESIREWGLRFGRLFANALKRRRPRPGDKWFMDEVLIPSANSPVFHFSYGVDDEPASDTDRRGSGRNGTGCPCGLPERQRGDAAA